MQKFPDNFIWGVSTSAHQIEGGNTNDWSVWEQENAVRLAGIAEERFDSMPAWPELRPMLEDPKTYISGTSTDHYNRYLEDIAIMKDMGIKAFRLSFEWSRIEPEEGVFNEEAIRHYHAVVDALRASGIQPWVTLWHRTSPLWIAQQGNWSNRKTVDDYNKYVEYVVAEFKDSVEVWMPLNEPVLHVAGGFLGGKYPPARKNILAACFAFNNLVRGQKKAYATIHAIQPDATVGLCHAAIYVEPYKNRFYNRAIVWITNYLANWKYLSAVRGAADFIGVQYYVRSILNLNIWPNPRNDKFSFVEEVKTAAYPPGIYNFISEAWNRYHLPIVVTENGLIDPHDEYRARYLEDHLVQIQRAIADGIDVRGYLHWSLLDNFEWDKGFWPRYGLVEIDYKTLKRIARPSFHHYAEIIRNNGL